MRGSITLCYWEQLSSSDHNVIKVLKFLGGVVKLIKLDSHSSWQLDCLRNAVTRDSRLVISAEALNRWVLGSGCKFGLQDLGGGLAPNILVYDFTPAHNDLIRELSRGALTRVTPMGTEGRSIKVADDFPGICRQFAGLCFRAEGANQQLAFDGESGTKHVSSLVSVGAQPIFVVTERAGTRWMLLASEQIANLDETVPRDRSILHYFCNLAPLMMFLYGTSDKEFWENELPSACFIVDDPLLTKRYGFLDYKRLLQEMEQHKFCTSIAFIPWNFGRTDQRVADSFAEHAGQLSLSVHGSDHTRGEFGASDPVLLEHKAREAVQRMKKHRDLCGVDFDEVMVFPQGIFSTAAMKALKACGYLAAVNSTAYAIDAPDSITLRDLMQVAVMRYSDFPLFTRRYPQSIPELAFDLFLGKPALIVEHHGFFRNGYKPLTDTIQKLFRMDARLQWSSLGVACSRTCLKKIGENEAIQIKFFTNRFSFRNQTLSAQRYLLTTPVRSPSEIKAASCNGSPIDLVQDAEGTSMEVTLEAGQAADLTVESFRAGNSFGYKPQTKVAQVKVFVRRSLCEFRDNYLDRSLFLSESARQRSGGQGALTVGRV